MVKYKKTYIRPQIITKLIDSENILAASGGIKSTSQNEYGGGLGAKHFDVVFDEHPSSNNIASGNDEGPWGIGK